MLPFGVNHVDAKRSGRYPRMAFLIYSKSVLQQKSLSSEWRNLLIVYWGPLPTLNVGIRLDRLSTVSNAIF